MSELTKRQEKVIKKISRYADGFCTSSKAYKTHQELQALHMLEIKDIGAQLTPLGIEVAKVI